MNIFTSAMEMFRGQPTAAATQVQPNQTQNGQQQQGPTPSMDPQKLQTPPGQEPQAAADVSPLDGFKDLWKNEPRKEGEVAEFNPSQIFNLDPASMQEAVGKINFAEVVSKEQLAQIAAGGEEAMGAFVQALNAVSQKTMATSTTVAAKMIEQAMTGASSAMESRINKSVKLNQVSSQLQESNPALSHPAAAPIMEGLKQQFTSKHPTASATEIAGMVNSYMKEFADMAAGKKPAEETQVDQGTDWSKFFGG